MSTLTFFVLALIAIQILGLLIPPTLASATTQREITIALDITVLVLALAEQNNALAALIGFFLFLNFVGLVSNIRAGSAHSRSHRVAVTEQRAGIERAATNAVESFYINLEDIYLFNRSFKEPNNIARAASACRALTLAARREVSRTFLTASEATLPTACETALVRARPGVFGEGAPNPQELPGHLSLANNLKTAQYVSDRGLRFDLVLHTYGRLGSSWLINHLAGGPFSH